MDINQLINMDNDKEEEIKIVKEMLRMEPHWGTLTTVEQIAGASEYVNDLFYEDDDFEKEKAYHRYIRKDGEDNFHRIRCEIALYKMIGQISSYFLGRMRLRNTRGSIQCLQ